MSIATIIMGDSGTGKSASLRNLDPSKTLLIQCSKKPLPFRATGWKVVAEKGDGGNIFVSDNSAHIVAAMQRTDKPVIIIDDFQYLMSNEFMRRVTDNEVGNSAFQKYNEIARHAWDVLTAANNLPADKRVYILTHLQTDDFGKVKVKTIGKLLDEKIVIEGLVSIVLRTVVDGGQYKFSTMNSGADSVKAPMGLFEESTIDNDIAAIDAAICDYYQITKE